MAKSNKTSEPYEVVTTEAEEREAVEQHWPHAAGAKLRKPPKDYKYVDELAYLQFELIKLQEWVRLHGLKLLVLFEGRDAAGKGGAIKRISEPLNPRVCRVVALGTPTERERGPVVLPALRRPSAGQGRDRAARSQLVQPLRRRARDGLLHR
jgi:polyphosphate kinase 2 (PPK2 family)